MGWWETFVNAGDRHGWWPKTGSLRRIGIAVVLVAAALMVGGIVFATAFDPIGGLIVILVGVFAVVVNVWQARQPR